MKLIDLPYTSLEPVISDRTLSFHHGKHLRGYVDTLGKLIAGTEYENMSLEDIIRTAPAGPVFNNAGQILNHNLYFTQFKTPVSFAGLTTPSFAGSSPSSFAGLTTPSFAGLTGESPLLRQLLSQWGTPEAFQTEFEQKGVTLFGSGWVWLAAAQDGSLQILQCPGADNPVAHGLRPLLTLDVWEHAYYLDYQNRRADHLKALWEIVDWREVEKRY